MSSIRPVSAGCVPDFGPCVDRRRLLDVFAGGAPRLLVLAAPGGYGKSILAAQIAALPTFDDRVWFDAGGREFDSADLLRGLCRLCEPRPGDESESPTEDVSFPALLRSLESEVSRRGGRRQCVVVDNIILETRVPDFMMIADAISRGTGVPAGVMVTTRSLVCGRTASLSDAWVLEAEDLRLNATEAGAILGRLQGGACDGSSVSRLLEVSGGHVALFCVLGRHAVLRSIDGLMEGEAPADLSGRLRELAEGHFDPRERRVLHVAALLGHGTEAELERLVGGAVPGVVDRLADCLPLLRRGVDEDESLTFHLHDLARGVFADARFPESSDGWTEGAFDRVLECLDARDDCESVISLLVARRDTARLIAWLDKRGKLLFDKGATGLLLAALQSVPPTDLIVRPRLVLLQAQAKKRVGQPEDAIKKARLAAQLAEHDGDRRTHVHALILVARLTMNEDPYEARQALERILERDPDHLDADTGTLVHTLFAVVAVNLGETREAFRQLDLAKSLVSSGAVCPMVQTAEAYALGEGEGDIRGALAVWMRQNRSRLLPVDERISCLGNLAQCLCDLARLQRADGFCRRASELCDSHSSHEYVRQCEVTSTFIVAGQAEYAAAEEIAERNLSASNVAGDDLDCALQHLTRSVWRRAAGDIDGAMSDAECAYERLGGAGPVGLQREAQLELAASMLALGDARIARGHAESVRTKVEVSGDAFRLLRADLILAEIERQRGDTAAAIARMAAQADYVRSENGNWQTAMYIRAFPGLLGVLAAGVGVDKLPAHLLRMVLPENAERALPMARDVLAEDEFRSLATRLLGAKAARRMTASAERVPLCRVRLFGGMQVVVGDRVVADPEWKKRKARLLFAMMITRKGTDVPREQLFEALWPEMDAEHARSNFYVVSNNMKRALSPRLARGERSPYFHAAGNVCRVDDALVTSDLEDFQKALAEGSVAEAEGDDAAALAAYARASELYHGDLLPGDLYDDWFASLRERCRREFGDAMLRAARLADATGNADGAVRMARAALEHDPWREDLYQAVLRSHIAAGQRSAAVDTYFSCSRRLADDLGLDPSVETRRLYEQVLAMEDGPAEMSGEG
jgi:DNA-binding SARP family transcriptional activator/ATP/maltotriose-dependent transcriptional regulator MalT